MISKISIVALAATVTISGSISTSLASNMLQSGSGSESFFASQSDVFQQSIPAGANPWTAIGGAVPATATPLAIPPSVIPTPALTIAPPIPFSSGGFSYLFNDGQPVASVTDSKAVLDDVWTTTPTLITDAAINIPHWRFYQANGATGYTYQQINFQSNYLVYNNGGGLASSSIAPGLTISGNVVPGGGAFVKFDSVINYDWIPVTINTAGVIGISGPTVNLGTVSYSFFQSGGGVITPTTLSNLSAPVTGATGDGMLVLTGHAWIKGDPFDITIVPEPTSLGLLGLVALVGLRRRK